MVYKPTRCIVYRCSSGGSEKIKPQFFFVRGFH